MPAAKPLPPVEALRELISYSVVTGKCYWKKDVANNVKAGSEAGNVAGDRLKVTIGGKYLQLSRVIWKIVTGEEPGALNHVDHEDEDAMNNSWHNLRVLTPEDNNRNKTKRPHVAQLRSGGWVARFKQDGITKQLGHYDTREEAVAAWWEKKEELLRTLEEVSQGDGTGG